MTQNNSQLRRAFTLVEILVVVVILGLISAVIIPQIGSRDDLRCAASARVVMSDLIYAQNLAISQQSTKYVKFTSTGYGVYNAGTAATAITHPVNKTAYLQTFGASGSPGLVNTSIGTSTFDGSPTLAFDELGSPYSYNAVANTITPLAAAGEIVLVSGTYRLKVSIEPFTGEMTVVQD